MSAPLPTTLRLLTSITDVPAPVWDALVDPESVPFLEWGFLAALEESGSVVPERGWHPRHLTLWRGSRLIAAAPAYLKDDSHGEFVFDAMWATTAERAGIRYYPKLVLGVPFTPATGRRVLVAPGEDAPSREAELYTAALEYARAEGLSSVHVLFPTEAELPVLEAQGYALRLGVQYLWRNAGYRTFDDFLARFRSKRRHQIQRERHAVEALGISLRTLRGDALEDVDAACAHRLYVSTVDRYPWGVRSLTEDFFARLLAGFKHRCEFVEARREGRRVAGAFNFTGPRTLYGRYWGAFEEHPFLHFNVCLYHPVEDCIARGRERFEPGAGGEHKLTRGFEPHLTYSAHLFLHPGLDRAVRGFLAHERAAVESGLPLWWAETGFKERV